MVLNSLAIFIKTEDFRHMEWSARFKDFTPFEEVEGTLYNAITSRYSHPHAF